MTSLEENGVIDSSLPLSASFNPATLIRFVRLRH